MPPPIDAPMPMPVDSERLAVVTALMALAWRSNGSGGTALTSDFVAEKALADAVVILSTVDVYVRKQIEEATRK